MTTRILPPDEWPKLAGTELGQAAPYFDPERATIIVVEDGSTIVGCWALLSMWHVEGVWIHPEHRKAGAVARRLMRGMTKQAKDQGARVVITAALSDEVVGLIGHLGGQLLPWAHFSIPVNIREEDVYRSVGQRFHVQLEQLLTEENHPDDDAHNVAVGRALVTAIQRGAIEDAERVYNAWADGAGYVPIRYLSTRQGAAGPELVVDIQSAVIAVDSQFNVALIQERM